jgi:hypothetical protein
MDTLVNRVTALSLLALLVAGMALPKIAHADDDTAAIIGGLLAGVIVYEMLDDDDDYNCYRRGYAYWGSPSGPPSYDPWRNRRPTDYYYYQRRYYPPVVEYRYYDDRPRGRGYCDAPYSYRAQRAPSHAQRNVGPPPLYRGGGRYGLPPRYYK